MVAALIVQGYVRICVVLCVSMLPVA
uniref:Uncharacterized protein n=1 Tax=Vitis vinifera TaxID=29760 RepID=F6I2D9_VITVI